MGLGTCISNKFPAGADPAGPGITPGEQRPHSTLLILQLLLECHLTTSFPLWALFCKWTLFDAQTPKLPPTGLPLLLGHTKNRTSCFNVYIFHWFMELHCLSFNFPSIFVSGSLWKSPISQLLLSLTTWSCSLSYPLRHDF